MVSYRQRPVHVYEVRPRADNRGFDLISEAPVRSALVLQTW